MKATHLVSEINRYLGEEKRPYYGFALLQFLARFLEFVPPLVIGKLVNFLIGEGKSTTAADVATYVAWWAAAGLLAAVLGYVCRKRLGRIGVTVRSKARSEGFERAVAHRQPSAKEQSGALAQRVSAGADAMRDWTNSHSELSRPLVAFLGITISCIAIQPLFGLFCLYYVAALIGLGRYFDKRGIEIGRNIAHANEASNSAMVEAVGALKTIQASHAGGRILNAATARESQAESLTVKRERLNNQKWMAFQVHNSLSWAIYLGGICYCVLNGHIGVGLVATYAQYFRMLRSSMLDFVDRLQVLTDRFGDAIRFLAFVQPNHSAQGGSKPYPANWKTISMQGAAVSVDGHDIVAPTTLSVRRGEKIAIVGPSGAGKSTLLKLLAGLIPPSSGEVSIGEVPVRSLDESDLTREIGFVLQDTDLFDMTLLENLCLFRTVPDDVLARILNTCCLDEMVARLPAGLDTKVGEKGGVLSGGERQRVAIARTLLRQPSILLLDEATSALDPQTEARVLDNLRAQEYAFMTVLAVAHRPAARQAMDREIVVSRPPSYRVEAETKPLTAAN